MINPDEMHSRNNAVMAFNKEIGLRPDEKILIKKFFPTPPVWILDLGCGNGRTTVSLNDMGYKVIGVDISEPLIRSAKQINPSGNYLVGDVRSLSFRPEQFDAVLFSWNGLDYIYPQEKRKNVINDIWTVLKPGGIFFYSSHNMFGVWTRIWKPIWLTLNALRFMKDQIPIRRYLLEWYCVWRDEALGRPIFYSAPPKVQMKLLQKTKWTVLAVRSVRHPLITPKMLTDVHVNYICKKM